MTPSRTITATAVLSVAVLTSCGAPAQSHPTAYRASSALALSRPAESMTATLVGAPEVQRRQTTARLADAVTGRIAADAAEAARVAAEVQAAAAAQAAADAAARAEEVAAQEERDRAASAAPAVTSAPPATRAAAPTTTIYEPPAPQSQTTRGDTPPEYIRQCESGGNPRAVNPNGHYGSWQFSVATWDATARRAGRPDLVGVRPDQASSADQDSLASVLYAGGAGAGNWSCA